MQDYELSWEEDRQVVPVASDQLEKETKIAMLMKAVPELSQIAKKGQDTTGLFCLAAIQRIFAVDPTAYEDELDLLFGILKDRKEAGILGANQAEHQRKMRDLTVRTTYANRT